MRGQRAGKGTCAHDSRRSWRFRRRLSRQCAGAHSSPLGNEYFAVMNPGAATSSSGWRTPSRSASTAPTRQTARSWRACEQINESLLSYAIGGTAVQPALAESSRPTMTSPSGPSTSVRRDLPRRLHLHANDASPWMAEWDAPPLQSAATATHLSRPTSTSSRTRQRQPNKRGRHEPKTLRVLMRIYPVQRQTTARLLGVKLRVVTLHETLRVCFHHPPLTRFSFTYD